MNANASKATELIAALTRRDAYPFPVDRVEVLQTHISMLFFAGQRVYKIKKSVNLGFLDYSTVEARRHFCEEEVRLNRRLAPQIYLAMQPITLESDNRVRVAGKGKVIEYAVEMIRLPEHRMLNRMLERGEVDNELLNDLVGLLARFHKQCATGPEIDEYAAPNELRRQVQENLQELGESSQLTDSHAPDQRVREFLRNALIRFIDDNEKLLQRRIAQEHIRDGHGDLHSGNICITESGIVIYDCIEFSPRFRCRDVACELAFLAMDLDFQGCRAFSRYLVKRYADSTTDAELGSLMRFYKSHLALVRAKVAELRRIDSGMSESDRLAAAHESARYLHLAAGYMLGPALIIMCGLPGTGKSRIARALAGSLNAVKLQSDAIRKHLAGIDPADHTTGVQRNIYSAEFSQRTYAALIEHARAAIRSGRIVIVDATMPNRAARAEFLNLAKREHIPAAVVYTKAPSAVVQRRLARRQDESHEVSDANWQVYADARFTFYPPREVPTALRLTLKPSCDLLAATTQLLDRLTVQHIAP